MSEPAESTRGQDHRRGAFALLLAKLYFILCSFVVQLALPRLFPSKAEFGDFSAVMNLFSIVSNVLIVSGVQTVSRFVTGGEGSEGSEKGQLRFGLKTQGILGGTVALIVWLSAPMIATTALLDSALTPMIRNASVVALTYSLYAVCVGFLNGQRLFVKQAGLDMVFSTLRVGAIVGAAALGFGALGAIKGFAYASVLLVVVAIALAGLGSATKHAPLGLWLHFLLPVMVYQLAIVGMQQADLIMLKRTVSEMLATELGGVSGQSSARLQLSSTLAADYRAAQTFAFIPYQFTLSLTFILFPLVAKAAQAEQHERLANATKSVFRFSLFAVLAVSLPLSGAADGIIAIAYPASYLVASDALQILSLSIGTFALFIVGSTIVNAMGRPWVSASVALLGIATALLAISFFVSRVPPGPSSLAATAWGTFVGAGISFVCIYTLLSLRYGQLLGWITILRVLVASVPSFWITSLLPHTQIWTAPFALLAGFCTFVGVLWLSREIDRQQLRHWFQKRS